MALCLWWKRRAKKKKKKSIQRSRRRRLFPEKREPSLPPPGFGRESAGPLLVGHPSAGRGSSPLLQLRISTRRMDPRRRPRDDLNSIKKTASKRWQPRLCGDDSPGCAFCKLVFHIASLAAALPCLAPSSSIIVDRWQASSKYGRNSEQLGLIGSLDLNAPLNFFSPPTTELLTVKQVDKY